MSNSDMDAVQSSELLRLQEKVRALERQNEILKQSKTGEVEGAKRSSIISAGDDDDIKLLEIEDLDGSDENWLFEVTNGEEEVEGDEETDWLRADAISPASGGAGRKMSLISKLDDIAKSK